MKKSFTILAAVLFTATLFAQSPEKMSYQAVIRNSSDQLITNKAVGMQITIVQGTASGSSVYTETQSPTTNANGLVIIEIGTGTVQNGIFANIDWSVGPYFIKTQTDPAGGSNYTISGTSQLLSTPYALYAKKAGGMTETDPIYATSVASSITASDTTNWNNKLDSETQTLADVLTQNNSANSQNITNLATPINAQDAATKAYVDALLAKIEALEEESDILNNGITDKDDNHYNVVKIGTQIWMAENLKTTKYNDGTSIPLVTGNTAWTALTTPAYCWYKNDSATYAQTYGALYNWYAVDTGKLCPIGWHVPDTTEWITLETYLGGKSVAGGKLKETDTIHWNSPNTGATNTSGFTARPGAFRHSAWSAIGDSAYWWSATEGRYRAIYNTSSSINSGGYNKPFGMSIRCLKD